MFIGSGIHVPGSGYTPPAWRDPATGLLWLYINGQYYSIPDKICKTDLAQWLDGNPQFGIYNSGIDYGDCGRPDWLINNMRPSVDEFSFSVVCVNSGSDVQRFIFGIGGRFTVPDRQIGLRFNAAFGDKKLVLYLGGVQYESAAILDSYLGIVFIDGIIGTDFITVRINGVPVISFSGALGSYVDTQNRNFLINSVDSNFPADYNFDALTCCLRFYSGYDLGFNFSGLPILEWFTLDQGTGTSTPGINETPCNWTDGAPNELWRYKWLEDLSGNFAHSVYDTSTSLIYPNYNNNAAVLAITGLDSTDGITQASFSSAHNGTTIFTSATEFKSLLYSSAQTGTCQTTALDYVGK